jgi:Panthothenate kinase
MPLTLDNGDVAAFARTAAARLDPDRRTVLAIAGPPGAGKTTLAADLSRELAALGRASALVPMDGFHFDNAVLAPRGWLPRKGAPHTFDAAGYRALIARIRAEPEAEIAVPVFDRGLDLARAGAATVPAGAGIVVTEGNYLLLDEAPWRDLDGLFDLTVFVETAMEDLAARLVRRWLDHGHDQASARRRAEVNDLPNAALVIARSRPADIVWKT